MIEFISVLGTSILGAQICFYLIHDRRMSTVRASSGSTLAFAILIGLLPIPFITTLRAAFFGATFVGMSDRSRLGRRRVLLASFIFSVIFTLLVPLFKGFGGTLGTAAFISSSAAFLFHKLAKKFIPLEPS
jgi:hypothetical protein